jgi:hypothetical protein
VTAYLSRSRDLEKFTHTATPTRWTRLRWTRPRWTRLLLRHNPGAWYHPCHASDGLVGCALAISVILLNRPSSSFLRVCGVSRD